MRKLVTVTVIICLSLLALSIAGCSGQTTPATTQPVTTTVTTTATAQPTTTAEPSIKIPAEITVSGPPVTSSPSILLLGVVPEYEALMGTKVKMIPTDLLSSQCLLCKIGKADLWNVHLGSGYRALFGVEEYCTYEWGPQRIRLSWAGAMNRLGMAARENSGIETIADLEGRKIAVYTGSEGFIGACLAFAGLTLDDVQVVPATGYTGALTMLVENKVEAAFTGISSAGTYEIAESPGGLRFLPLPKTDAAGWKRLQRVYPALIPSTVPEGIGVEESWGVEILGFPRALFAYDTNDPGVSYATAKAWTEGYEAYKDRHNELVYNTLENALDVLLLPCPYHQGSIAYFEEIGVWTDELEQWQQNQLRLEQARQDAWAEAIADAESRDIKVDVGNAEWLALWQSYLDNIE